MNDKYQAKVIKLYRLEIKYPNFINPIHKNVRSMKYELCLATKIENKDKRYILENLIRQRNLRPCRANHRQNGKVNFHF